ncbi:MAG TPA: nitroreductase family deazaflavin-dependent oxidoreductase [Actinomycetota bacterium]|jgi:deazaflavin-dependent oxidoreductase (nitroreductase family)|nr:nitroreductase family deazaflavin-dependent oxidoreductase [Actinomycetota bacterium]
MPTDFQLKTMNKIHRALFNASGGRIGGNLLGMLVVDLITTGAKSGQKRSSMLTSPVQEGEKIVLVASRGGDPQHPGWYHNIKANPDVEVRMRGGTKQMRARVATKDEKTRLWPDVVKKYRGYGQYQTRTTRDIPLVILEPRS